MDDPHVINTKQPLEVARAVKAAFSKVWSEGSSELLDRMFDHVIGLFGGRDPSYQAIDMEYHDLAHTLEATLCTTRLLEGRAMTKDKPALKSRDWEIAVIAALMHDTGFLKKKGDRAGSGAKYTYVHERRSCDVVRLHLPGFGFSADEIEDVCSAIMCTGPRIKIGEAVFPRTEARIIAYMLVSADYLSQMSAPDYLEKLPKLYAEFEESFTYNKILSKDRPYSSLRQLLEMTPGFWAGYVLPLLDQKLDGVYHYLSPKGQPNPYTVAVEANLTELMRRLETGDF